MDDELKKLVEKYPEFQIPQPGLVGDYKCRFCEGNYATLSLFKRHFKIKRSCKQIRRLAGYPILEDVEWKCKWCGKGFSSRSTMVDHSLNCGGGGEIRVIQFTDGFPSERKRSPPKSPSEDDAGDPDQPDPTSKNSPDP